MKRIGWLGVLLLMMGGGAWANDQSEAKLTAIKKMYQQDLKKQNGLATLAHFAGADLKKALKKQDAFGAKYGELCGLDYDVLWQSQDPDYAEPLQYALTRKGQVTVSIGRPEQAQVTYALNCEADRCQITDVFSNGGSVVKMINRTCR
ncbi:MAG: hypothetical protein KA346_07150 [Neisseriaceae bacterium]|nr:hypothetical protein [Neisseriaceae bacterium]